MMFHHVMLVMNHSSRFSDVSKFLMILNETSSILTSTNQKNNMSHRPTLITPSIPELIWVKKVRAIVVCGFLIKFLKKTYPENLKQILGSVWELPAK